MYSPLSVSREWEVVMNECGVEDYSSVTFPYVVVSQNMILLTRLFCALAYSALMQLIPSASPCLRQYATHCKSNQTLMYRLADRNLKYVSLHSAYVNSTV